MAKVAILGVLTIRIGSRVYRPSHKKLNGTGGGALPLLHSTAIVLHSLTAVADDATLALS